MTLTIAPVPAKTASGAQLPFVALPQTELLTVNENNIPLLRDTLAAGVHVKPLRLDLEAGCWVVLATFSPGAEIPLHYHTGIAEVYTLSGRWYYAEYPDQPQTAGSYLFEPAGSVHTLIVPATNTEDTVMYIRVEGANINFTQDAQFHSILDTVTIRHLTDQLAEPKASARSTTSAAERPASWPERGVDTAHRVLHGHAYWRVRRAQPIHHQPHASKAGRRAARRNPIPSPHAVQGESHPRGQVLVDPRASLKE